MSKRWVVLLIILYVCPPEVMAGGISASAAVVMESDNDLLLYEKNANVRMFPASTAKLMTAILACERLDLNAITIISRKAALTPSVTPLLRLGEKFTVKDLLYMALMRSVNSAAVALAEEAAGSEEAFAKLMNEKVAALGLKDTHFVNASGLPGEGQHITAYDLAIIMKEALRIPSIEEIMNTRVKVISSLGGRRLFLKNTNKLLWTDENLVAGKTGYTRAARHCFVCAVQKGGDRIIIVVLGLAKREELWSETEMLISRVSSDALRRTKPETHLTKR